MEIKDKDLNQMKIYRENISLKLSDLEKKEDVKAYLKLTKMLKEADSAYDNLVYSSKLEEYDSCEHLIVLFDDDYDWYEGRHNYKYGCLKCGLNTYTFDNNYNFSIEDKANNEYMRRCHSEWLDGTYVYHNTYYDTYNKFLRAKELYSLFRSKDALISDEMILKMIEETTNKEKEKLKNKEYVVYNN